MMPQKVVQFNNVNFTDLAKKFLDKYNDFLKSDYCSRSCESLEMMRLHREIVARV